MSERKNIRELTRLILEDWDPEVFQAFCCLVKMTAPARQAQQEQILKQEART